MLKAQQVGVLEKNRPEVLTENTVTDKGNMGSDHNKTNRKTQDIF